MANLATLAFLALCCAFAPRAIGQTAGPLELRDFGLDFPTDASCAGVTVAGWYIDRAYNSKCFIRQVRCTAVAAYDTGVGYVTCAKPDEVFIADSGSTSPNAATDCHSSDSTQAKTACGVSVICKTDQLGIIVSDAAIWNQTDAALQLGGSAGICQAPHDSGNAQYNHSLSLLNDDWNTCGITRELVQDNAAGDGYSVKYSFMVKRYEDRTSLRLSGANKRVEEQHNSVVVTREKCFMVEASCYYNADGTVTSKFKPSSANILTQSATSQLTFSLEPTNCAVVTRPALTAPQVVFVTDRLCFHAKITSNWHPQVRMNIQKCWASPANDPSIKYDLADRLASITAPVRGEIDSTFDFDCYGANSNRFIEDFSFDAFRFQNETQVKMNNPASYNQAINVFCDVVACDRGDTSSAECQTTCTTVPNNRRARRDVASSALSRMTRQTVMGRAFVMPTPDTKIRYVEKPARFYQDTFSMLLFGTGCVLGVVVIGLMTVLRRMKSEVKYGLMHESHNRKV